MRISKSRLREIILEELEETPTPELTESEILSENMLAALAPKIMEFIIKNPKMLQLLSNAMLPAIMKAMGGDEKTGGASDMQSMMASLTQEE